MSSETHRDRSAALIAFGVVEILIGVFVGLMVPLMVVAVVASRALGPSAPALDLKTALPSMVIYGAVAVLFIALGIGSIRARRWARALMLSLSWLWLITGLMSMVLLWAMMLPNWGDIAASSGLPEATATVVLWSTSLFLGFVYVLLPLAFVLFYRSDNVVDTCRARDPNPSWFDDTPPQVVSLVAVYALGLLSLLVMPAYNFMFPLFGTIVTGWGGFIAWMFVAALLIFLVVATIRHEAPAWGAAMAASVVAAASSTVTAAMVPYADWIDAIGLPAEQREMVFAFGSPSALTMVVVSMVVWASWIGYLVYVRQWFIRRDP
jgi:hypothetical protein